MTRPPRLIARTLAVTFVTVAAILSIVFIVLSLDARDRVRAAETEKLRVSGRVFTALEARRQRDQLSTIATLAENPTLKAALDTYFTESRFAGVPPELEDILRRTVTTEVDKLAMVTGAPVLAILDTDGRVFASASSGGVERWPVNERVDVPGGPDGFQSLAVLSTGAYRVSGAPLRFDDRDIGMLVLATSLDANYAQELSELSGAGIVVAVDDRVVARTVAADVAAELLAARPGAGATPLLNGEEYAVGTLLASGPARIYTLTSIDAAARNATREALTGLAMVALGGFVLALAGSVWLARTLTGPINRVSNAIATMTAARDFRRTLAATGSSREVDALATAFNDLMRGLSDAEAETRAAYLGAIRALAAALDARDPYTAGHSERVSGLSVLIARHLGLPEAEVDVIRLGALLHDIGKIGVPDDVLRKPGALTAEEFEQIKRHPALGARILRQVPFLAPHLPIVELHHERPDGKGYPFGLRHEDIPMDARIVHVADAFDAMTSARAYRPARGAAVALAELHRFAGTEFDRPCVEALASALPSSSSLTEPQLQELLGRGA